MARPKNRDIAWESAGIIRGKNPRAWRRDSRGKSHSIRFFPDERQVCLDGSARKVDEHRDPRLEILEIS
jgi:hypothetical protein